MSHDHGMFGWTLFRYVTALAFGLGAVGYAAGWWEIGRAHV